MDKGSCIFLQSELNILIPFNIQWRITEIPWHFLLVNIDQNRPSFCWIIQMLSQNPNGFLSDSKSFPNSLRFGQWFTIENICSNLLYLFNLSYSLFMRIKRLAEIDKSIEVSSSFKRSYHLIKPFLLLNGILKNLLLQWISTVGQHIILILFVNDIKTNFISLFETQTTWLIDQGINIILFWLIWVNYSNVIEWFNSFLDLR